jgi:hypothetical protein
MTRTHPPLDPELATDEELRRHGTVDLGNCSVPVPPGAPGFSQ